MLLHILTDKIRKQCRTSQHGYHKNCIKPEKEMKTIIWFNCKKLCIHTYMHMLKIYMRIKNNKNKVLLSTKKERLMCGKVGGRDHTRGFYFLCEYLLFIKILTPDYRFQIPKSFIYFFFYFCIWKFPKFLKTKLWFWRNDFQCQFQSAWCVVQDELFSPMPLSSTVKRVQSPCHAPSSCREYN